MKKILRQILQTWQCIAESIKNANGQIVNKSDHYTFTISYPNTNIQNFSAPSARTIKNNFLDRKYSNISPPSANLLILCCALAHHDSASEDTSSYWTDMVQNERNNCSQTSRFVRNFGRFCSFSCFLHYLFLLSGLSAQPNFPDSVLLSERSRQNIFSTACTLTVENHFAVFPTFILSIQEPTKQMFGR